MYLSLGISRFTDITKYKSKNFECEFPDIYDLKEAVASSSTFVKTYESCSIPVNKISKKQVLKSYSIEVTEPETDLMQLGFTGL